MWEKNPEFTELEIQNIGLSKIVSPTVLNTHSAEHFQENT